MDNLDHVGASVIKIGTSSILDEHGVSIDMHVLEHLADDVSQLWLNEGKRFAIVTSGAVAAGKKSDNEDERTAAGRGMPKLLGLYEDLFEKRGLGIAQLLISSEQLSDHDDMRRLAQRINDWWNTRTVPIINENDPIARSSATRGDNDSLSAEVAIHVSAQTIVFMSIERETSMGRGGADAKAAAMSKAESKGIRTMVVDGKAPHVIKGLFDGGNVLRKALRDGEAIRSGNGRKISSV